VTISPAAKRRSTSACTSGGQRQPDIDYVLRRPPHQPLDQRGIGAGLD
jgi:hypothetical protein